ncbi:hypothetical protein [Glycomyces tenuis]|uniref:hypothetical protein n=1 Tax=Glycomyces tenuis TaxID=58116 RepID=UPI0004113997|nr:hypothetical protein [Glycomyces tenuis]
MTVKNRARTTATRPNRLLSLPAILSAIAITVGIVILCIAWSISAQQNVAASEGGGYEFAIGTPGPSQTLPERILPTTDDILADLNADRLDQ